MGYEPACGVPSDTTGCIWSKKYEMQKFSSLAAFLLYRRFLIDHT